MVLKLKDKDRILPRLYEDFVSYVEEISLIEERYLWRNVTVYVDDSNVIEEFLILHSSYHSGKGSLSAYMTAQNTSTIREFADVLKEKRTFQTHLQTATEADLVERFMLWLNKNYTARYCRADASTFKPHCHHRESVVRLTLQNVKQLEPSASPLFVKRLETAPIYACLNEKGELVAMSGVGYLTKKSFSISYTETKPEYRGRGIAKCLTSLASEPLINKGMIGVYAADITNLPSLEVAKDLGFQPYRDLKCFFN